MLIAKNGEGLLLLPLILLDDEDLNGFSPVIKLDDDDAIFLDLFRLLEYTNNVTKIMATKTPPTAARITVPVPVGENMLDPLLLVLLKP